MMKTLKLDALLAPIEDIRQEIPLIEDENTQQDSPLGQDEDVLQDSHPNQDENARHHSHPHRLKANKAFKKYIAPTALPSHRSYRQASPASYFKIIECFLYDIIVSEFRFPPCTN